MAKAIKVRDLTLCDEREPFSLIRLSDENLEKLLPVYRDAHYYILEIWREDTVESGEREISGRVWERLRSVERELSGVSLPAVLSDVRTLLGDGSHPTIDLDRACRTAFENGLDVIRFSDSENELELLKLAINKVSELGGIPDAAIRFIKDEEVEEEVMVEEHKGFLARLFTSSKSEPEVSEPLYDDSYYVRLATELEQNGAKIITIEDISGLLTPSRIFTLMPKLKIAVKLPIDFYVPSFQPGLALANTLMAIIKGVDIVDTSIWGYGGPMGGPAIELIAVFCRKLGITLDVDGKGVGELRRVMSEIAADFEASDSNEAGYEVRPDDFEDLSISLPYDIETEFDRAIVAAGVNDEETLLEACVKIERYFGFCER